MYTYVLYSSELQLYYTQVMRHVQSISLLFYKEVQLQLERHSFRMLAAAAGFVAYSPRTLMLCMVRLFPPDSDAKVILYMPHCRANMFRWTLMNSLYFPPDGVILLGKGNGYCPT